MQSCGEGKSTFARDAGQVSSLLDMRRNLRQMLSLYVECSKGPGLVKFNPICRLRNHVN